MKRLVGVLAVVWLWQVGTASAAVPGWCKEGSFESNRYDLDGLSSKDVQEVIITFVKATCAPSAEATANRAQIEAARQAWSKKLAMLDADWADAVGYAMVNGHDRVHMRVRVNTMGQEIGIGETLKRAWSSFDGLDQFAMIQNGVGGSGDLSLDFNYLTDALGLRLTEVGRLGYIKRCLDERDAAVQWAMCQGDIDRLDRAKLATELRSNKGWAGADKMLIRFELYGLEKALVAHAARVKKLIASDPGYGKVFEAAAATRKEWDGRYKTDAASLALALSMDDARATNSRKAFAGCEDKTWSAWTTALSTLPAKSFEGMTDDWKNHRSFTDQALGPLLSNPTIYLSAVALLTCYTVGQDRGAEVDYLNRQLGNAMQRWPGFRGPRTAAESAIMTTGIELDDRDAKLAYPAVSRPFGGSGSTSGGGAGVIAKLKPAGKTVTVVFKKQMVKQVQCAQYKSSNRIVQIRSNGELVYQTWCVKNETITVDKSSGPQTVNARYAAGLKPGMYVSIIEDVVVGAWAKPGAARPLIVYGAKLK